MTTPEYLTPGEGSAPPPEEKKKRRLIPVLAAVVVLAVIAVGGYFGYQAYDENQREKAAAAAAAEEKAQRKAAAAKLRRQVKACEDALGDYYDALETIDSRLNVGLNQGDLSDLAGRAAVEQGQVDDVPQGFCEDAERALDNAMYSYSYSASEWNDCIWDDYDCDPDTDLDLQSDWADAHENIVEAEELMSGEGAST